MNFLSKVVGVFLWPIRIIFKVLFLVLAFIFGRFSWSPPPWITFPISTIRKNIKISLIIFAALILALVGYGYYITHQPVKISVRSSVPRATPLRKDAKPERLNVYFSGPAAPLEMVDKPVEKGIRMMPQIRGSWRWIGDSQLTFSPEEDWAVGEKYEVSFERSMFPSHILLKEYGFDFKSAKFEARITTSEFYQDPRDPKLKKVVATVKFTHPVDAEDFEKRVDLRMKEKKETLFGSKESFPFTISYDEFGGEAYIHSDPVSIPDEDSFMVLTIDEGVRSSRGGPATDKELKAEIYIPGVYNFFRIASANISLVRNERFEPEQVLVIETTAGVLESEIRKAIDAYVLPKDRPEVPGRKARRNYWWSNPAEVGPEVLGKSEQLKLEPIPT
ncbi:hypothetical protein GTO10_00120, partial [Candidatus Saccharibacteria bacterium]|nr:hypothetical protein [Candidatus Saccharibacteria bacterium]